MGFQESREKELSQPSTLLFSLRQPHPCFRVQGTWWQHPWANDLPPPLSPIRRSWGEQAANLSFQPLAFLFVSVALPFWVLFLLSPRSDSFFSFFYYKALWLAQHRKHSGFCCEFAGPVILSAVESASAALLSSSPLGCSLPGLNKSSATYGPVQ